MGLLSSNHQKFTQYYHDYKDKIYSYVFYRVGSDGYLADDITSDIFLKAFNGFESYDDQFAFSTWIYRIARNTIIDHFRKHKKTQLIEFNEDYHDEENDEDVMHITDITLEMEKVHEALPSLPALQQDVILLKYLENLETADIATRLDQTPGNVRQALSRGMKTLRKKLLIITLLLITFPWI